MGIDRDRRHWRYAGINDQRILCKFPVTKTTICQSRIDVPVFLRRVFGEKPYFRLNAALKLFTCE